MSLNNRRDSLRRLQKKTWSRAVSAIMLDYVPVLVIFTCLWREPRVSWLTWVLAALVLGVQYHRLAILAHDGAHFLLFDSRRLNDLVSNTLLFYPLGTTAAGYRRWHYAHHRALGTESDPELAIRSGWRYSMPKSRRQFSWMFIADCFGLGSREVLQVMSACRPVSAGNGLGLFSYWAFVILLVGAQGRFDLLALHLASIFTVFWAISRLRMWCEHSGIPGTHRIERSPVVSYFLFPHNTWLHHEHHQWPGIPFYNLTESRNLDQKVRTTSLTRLFDFFQGGTASGACRQEPADGAARSFTGNAMERARRFADELNEADAHLGATRSARSAAPARAR